MAIATSSSNKAKIARRVVEVLDYFDDDHRHATVMDIVRRYGRPQSSTSELLSSLVELGLLFKDSYSRSYSLAPRAGLMGTGGQPSLIRDGKLTGMLDRLRAQTGLSIAVFGAVGLNVQVVSWLPGQRCSPQTRDELYGGLQDSMAASAAGWLLLSTVPQPRRDGLVRRLVAEAPPSQPLVESHLRERIEACRACRTAAGPVGFGLPAETITVLIPQDASRPPLAIGIVFGKESRVDREALLACLKGAVSAVSQQALPMDRIEALLTAA